MFTLTVLGIIVGFGVVYLFIWWQQAMKSVAVVVLGDIGRSPRMQYHALSLARNGFTVRIIGYAGSTPHRDVLKNKQISIVHLREVPSWISAMPRLFMYITKALWQIITLMIALVFCTSPSHILLQNPPAIPPLAVCWIVSLLRQSCFIVDWHNYGHTILSLTIRKSHPIVRFATWYEGFFGKMSTFNICVTKAMKADLESNWGVRAEVMYDRPPEIFRKTDILTKHSLFQMLGQEYIAFRHKDGVTDRTVFTYQHKGDTKMCPKRPALIISSTSWTEDEDFSILFEALEKYETACNSDPSSSLPNLVCIITGKGPQKQHYQSVISKLTWKHVTVCTPWLRAEDYPVLMGSADLGVCLHTSSSGLDLPMKVVDMFGCGVPVCAIHYKCLNELVQHDHNGLVFRTSTTLAEQIQSLLQGFPHSSNTLSRLSSNLKEFQQTRWDDTWDAVVKDLFRKP